MSIFGGCGVFSSQFSIILTPFFSHSRFWFSCVGIQTILILHLVAYYVLEYDWRNAYYIFLFVEATKRTTTTTQAGGLFTSIRPLFLYQSNLKPRHYFPATSS
jgi:hypothetical protein